MMVVGLGSMGAAAYRLADITLRGATEHPIDILGPDRFAVARR